MAARTDFRSPPAPPAPPVVAHTGTAGTSASASAADSDGDGDGGGDDDDDDAPYLLLWASPAPPHPPPPGDSGGGGGGPNTDADPGGAAGSSVGRTVQTAVRVLFGQGEACLAQPQDPAQSARIAALRGVLHGNATVPADAAGAYRAAVALREAEPGVAGAVLGEIMLALGRAAHGRAERALQVRGTLTAL